MEKFIVQSNTGIFKKIPVMPTLHRSEMEMRVAALEMGS